MTALVPTGPADLRDQRWLDERIATATNGIEAVIDIALNWATGREVGRLHPGVAPADYVREHVGLVGRAAIIPLLTETNWSNRQIAAVAGVSPQTVGRVATTVPDGTVDRPTETLGADGKLRPAPALRPRVDAADPILAARAKPEPAADYIDQMPPAEQEWERSFRTVTRWSKGIHAAAVTLTGLSPERVIPTLDQDERRDAEETLGLIRDWAAAALVALAKDAPLRLIGGSR